MKKAWAVKVINACKNYSDYVILNNLNITVEQGTIYGLLGASGCGKTTILSCITGLKTLDSGKIFINEYLLGKSGQNNNQSDIGYMPQDLALYEVLQIKEILSYFGQIYGMPFNEIKIQTDFLLKFLDLPVNLQQISSLSGGQKRRTSLAVAMLPQSSILILDEPSAGCDPLMRESIWRHLYELVESKQTTVILTTHYVEEARGAHKVGLMRNGYLLAEDSPSALLKEYQATLLEDVVYKLCLRDDSEIEPSHNINKNSITFKKSMKQLKYLDSEEMKSVKVLNYVSNISDDCTDSFYSDSRCPREKPPAKHFCNNFSRPFRNVKALIRRNFLLMSRHKAFVLFVLIIPALQTSLYNSVIGTEPKGITIGIINNEFINETYLEFCQLQMYEPEDCASYELSCNFLNQFQQSQINLKPFNSENSAVNEIEKGDIYGLISIPQKFTQSMMSRGFEGFFPTNETIDGSKISARLDMSHYLKSKVVISTIYKSYFSFVKSIAFGCGMNPRTIELPLQYHAVYGSIDAGYVDFMLPPQLLLIIFFLPMAVSLTFILDKRGGTLDRSIIAGVTYPQIIMSLAFTESCMIILELVLAFIVLMWFYGLTIEGSALLCFLLCLLTGICGLSLGFLFGTLCNSEIKSLLCIISIIFPCIITSGGVWPIDATPVWARYIIRLLPLPLAVESIRSIISRGWDFSHSHVWPGFAALSLWILFCCLMCGVIHRMKK